MFAVRLSSLLLLLFLIVPALFVAKKLDFHNGDLVIKGFELSTYFEYDQSLCRLAQNEWKSREVNSLEQIKFLIILDACNGWLSDTTIALSEHNNHDNPMAQSSGVNVFGKTQLTQRFDEQQMKCVARIIESISSNFDLHYDIDYDAVSQYVDCMDGVKGPEELHATLANYITSKLTHAFEAARQSRRRKDMLKVKQDVDSWLTAIDVSYWPQLGHLKRQFIDKLGINAEWIDSSLSCKQQLHARVAYHDFKQLYTDRSKNLSWYLTTEHVPDYPMKNLAIAIESDAHQAAQLADLSGERDHFGRTLMTQQLSENNLHYLALLYAETKEQLDRDPLGCHWISLDAMDNFLKCYTGPTDGVAGVQQVFTAINGIISDCVERSIEALRAATQQACDDEKKSGCKLLLLGNNLGKKKSSMLLPESLRKLLKAFDVLRTTKRKAGLSRVDHLDHDIMRDIVQGVRESRLDEYGDLMSLRSQAHRHQDVFHGLLYESGQPGPYREAVDKLCSTLSTSTFVSRFQEHVYRNSTRVRQQHIIQMDLRRQFNFLLRLVHRQRTAHLSGAHCRLERFARDDPALLYSLYMCTILETSDKDNNIIAMPLNYSQLAVGWFVSKLVPESTQVHSSNTC